MARGGLGWGPPDEALPRHALTGCDRACMEAGANLFLRASAIARHYDPTLTLPLPRSGDRKPQEGLETKPLHPPLSQSRG
ncbi:hypothetical protein J0895_20765 [Phormidium pseudopriestleyi FRX01]|uniref:Uncharacterized protein n=1 Tax=Phormidium pseudopriestleyi FRX01 TaxID=1759528 RepID=A0ABS3FWG4_9CYAN|nr:hypothetical protein [Phormidium pseudopriestleyi]MBO0351465.1 hypothetical protein [Phormidium pseudopriestleyi FRX01]